MTNPIDDKIEAKLIFKSNTMKTPIDDQIEAKLIAKIAFYRSNLRFHFRNRHHAAWPELAYKLIMGDISNLRVWLRMAERLEGTRTPYATYLAKQLTS